MPFSSRQPVEQSTQGEKENKTHGGEGSFLLFHVEVSVLCREVSHCMQQCSTAPLQILMHASDVGRILISNTYLAVFKTDVSNIQACMYITSGYYHVIMVSAL